MWGVYWPDSPAKHTVCAPGHTLASIMRRQQMGRGHCFWRLAISSNSCCHFHGKERREGSLGLNASGSERQIGQGVCSFDGDHKQWPLWGLQNHYIYINPRVLVQGDSLMFPPAFKTIWHQILEPVFTGPEHKSQVKRNILKKKKRFEWGDWSPCFFKEIRQFSPSPVKRIFSVFSFIGCGTIRGDAEFCFDTYSHTISLLRTIFTILRTVPLQIDVFITTYGWITAFCCASIWSFMTFCVHRWGALHLLVLLENIQISQYAQGPRSLPLRAEQRAWFRKQRTGQRHGGL